MRSAYRLSRASLGFQVSGATPHPCLSQRGRLESKLLGSRHAFFSRFSTRAEAVPPAKYDHASVEPKWQKYWAEEKSFKTRRREGKEKKYVLDMFPYPSGSGLHVGHPEGYTASDVMARYWRMKDYDVLHPMGWDSFGLPAEQHAINTGTHPSVTTYENIKNFKRQLKMLGFSYDWDRELATTDEDFVRWTQWIFLQLYRQGLAGQSEVLVNWCPALGTVLANEEVIDGLSERGSHPVKRMPLRQWVFKITEYGDKLLEGLEGLDWPEGTITAQRSWIGRSEGAQIEFELEHKNQKLSVFTTRPDTLMGVTYVCVAPEHPLAESLATGQQKEAVMDYIRRAASKSDMERTAVGPSKAKTGVFTGSYATHPLTNQKVPVWVADYVLGGYGSGAVMAVPAHDERDFAFAQTFGLPILEVVSGGSVSEDGRLTESYPGEGKLKNSGKFNGLSTQEAREAVISSLVLEGKGETRVQYKLRDWVFSRQRYWGEPIPIYFPVDMDSPTGDPRLDHPHTIRFEEPIAVDEEDLPLRLPEMEHFEPGDDPMGCLARAKDWRYFQKDGKWFARETNTMPQWAGSCWYYLRFADPTNALAPLSPEADLDWLPVDLYVGGQEHAVLHLLYARFWHKVLHELGVTSAPEPFQKLVHQGMILGSDGEKMSKSRGNVVNPDDVVNEHGADALRMYEMFMGPLEATKPWQTEQVSGVVRFRDKVFALASRSDLGGEMTKETLKMMHKTIKKVSSDIDKMSFNTAISALMVFTNHLQDVGKSGSVSKEAVDVLSLLVSPFAPHLGEECWKILGNEEGLAYHPWPQFDEKYCIDDLVKLGVQINGKVRGTIELAVDASEDDARAAAMRLDKVATMLEGKEVKKFIYRAGKIFNIVAK